MHQTSNLTCRKCGVGQSTSFRYLTPSKVQVDLKIIPARGSRTVSMEMINFFLLNWELSCQEVEGDGYTVVRGTPEVPPP